ncbi:glycosyltransferase [Allomesorhizobium camelthorni]|uniref:Glycosyltransferase family 4 protein n=1 Tax=Allomesorhizobium camelthorni TaxID=475069 RepID=A0A6G4WC91_9HYPH|nr:glycosyltransferase [Mesorhizobium camelthorni]NGO52219.1 glycosyltransferase family 4 protein [Mesorhizobium camelthorni]
MTRITVICNDSDYFLRHRLHVVERLADTGADVTVITGGKPMGKPPAGWRHEHMPIERFSFHPVLDANVIRRSLRHFRTEKPDAVHLITLKPAVLSGLAAVLARKLGSGPRQILITIPGLGRLMSPSSTRKRVADRLARSLVDASIRFLSSRPGVHFTFETADDCDDWLHRGLIGRHNSTVISGAGVDPERFHPAGDRRVRSPVKILFASRLLRSKGLDAFVEAARHYSGNSKVEFLVAGMVEPHDPDRYAQELLKRESAIKFLGEVSEMPELLRSVDLVCLPSRYGEGIPRILIEAAASAVPCLATDLQGCREIVRHDVNGTLIPPGDAGAMAASIIAAIDTYLADPELLDVQGRAGLKLFRNGQFGEDAVTEQFVRLLVDDKQTAAMSPALSLG